MGREKKTLINIFYREWTGGISKQNSQASQEERLKRQVQHWKGLVDRNKDVVIMGDANIDAEKWNDQDFPAAKRNLANQIQDFLLEDSFFQLVKDSTRSEVVNGSVQRSCIDHIYTNAPNKVDTPRVEAAGDSDHLAVLTTKYSKEVKLKPQTIKKRSYKNFNLGHFLSDIRDSDIVKDVVASSDIEEASKKFEDLFGSILDKHAPTKVFQIRKNYVPYLSNEAKLLMEERDALKTVGTKTNDPVLLQEFKQKSN